MITFVAAATSPSPFEHRLARAGREVCTVTVFPRQACLDLSVAPDLPHGFNALFPCEITRRWTQRNAEWFDRVLGR
jgi:hypothetical protein